MTQETLDFELFLPVSRLESEISRIIDEVCHFLSNQLSDNEISHTFALYNIIYHPSSINSQYLRMREGLTALAT